MEIYMGHWNSILKNYGSLVTKILLKCCLQKVALLHILWISTIFLRDVYRNLKNVSVWDGICVDFDYIINTI